MRPLGVRITPSHDPVREGSPLELRCRTWGSRPPADTSWWMGHVVRLGNVSGHRRDQDGSSGSNVRLHPVAKDHGQAVTCKAENPKLPGIVITDTVVLNVTCEYIGLGIGNASRLFSCKKRIFLINKNDLY